MKALLKSAVIAAALLISGFSGSKTFAVEKTKHFNVIAFFRNYPDPAHISFVKDANKFFPEAAKKYNFSYDTTSDWHNLNAQFLARYQVVLFLDSRPQLPEERAAFETYMKAVEAGLDFILLLLL